MYCVWRPELSDDRRRLTYGMDIFIRDGEEWLREQEEHTEYIHSTDMLAAKLRENGFTEIRLYGDLIEDKPKEDEQRIFISARRSEN